MDDRPQSLPPMVRESSNYLSTLTVRLYIGCHSLCHRWGPPFAKQLAFSTRRYCTSPRSRRNQPTCRSACSASDQQVPSEVLAQDLPSLRRRTGTGPAPLRGTPDAEHEDRSQVIQGVSACFLSPVSVRLAAGSHFDLALILLAIPRRLVC